MRFDEYRSRDGLGLAELVAAGEVSATELLAIALERMARVNPVLNAVVTDMSVIAGQRAATPLTGPFAGVPFLGKNLEQDYAGVVSANGCRALHQAAQPAAAHAEITARWLAAGVVEFGLTNCSEFGLLPVSEPRLWGPCRNPWNPALTPGGSSGGSAAAVAAGIAPLAGGNDVGGSIRTPAALCGLFGFKPGRARTPWGPARGETMHGAAANHVLTRSVRDSAAMLDATHGAERAAPFHIAPPPRPYRDEAGRDPGPLRIAYSTASPLGTAVDADAVAAVEHSARLLDALGHHVEAAEPPIPWAAFYDDMMAMMYVDTAVVVDAVRRATGCDARGFEPETWLMAGFGRAIRADEFAASLFRWHDYQRIVNDFMADYDVYLTPTLARRALRIGELATPRWEQKTVRVLQALGFSRWLLRSARLKELETEGLSFTPFTMLANLTGVPAMSVPLYWSAEGLPVGVHFLAGIGQEGRLLSLAGQLERAQPWFDRVPPELSADLTSA